MTRATIFKHYSKALAEVARPGDAREESFYAALAQLMTRVAEATRRPDVQVTTLPRPTEAGNPDFRVWNGADRITGYIEAKSPTEGNLTGIEASDQLRRYRETFPNLILTNFLEFRLYRDGQHVVTVHAASPTILNDLGHPPPIERPDELWALLDQFLDFAVPQAPNAEKLAVELAKRTRFLRNVLEHQITQTDEPGAARLAGFYEAFRSFLISDLTHADFADLYAQTITYGLFAARTRSDGGFSRRTAFDRIPHTIGILRDLFRFISLEELPPQLEWIVDDIAEVLAVADARAILDRYYHEGRGSDPIVHFYETFLAEYDPEERERRGVYYTPEPVVSYIVRSVHSLLKTEFDKPDGLASEGVTLLDPAAGTMTFVARAAQVAVAEFEANYGAGAREDFIRRHILANFYAFELMMAPYAVGHLKMAFFLEELGHRLADDERVRFYLTNTLDMEELAQSALPGFSSLAEESHLAGEIKKQTPILVILGNPPYSGHSRNMGDWIRNQIEEYKKDAPELQRPAQAKWLQDDYVKFLRFAQWKIDQAGRGMIGMITNHAYLDNPTFRGMRQSLLRSFDDIYVLDLHGNALKRETCPDGSPDENVFDIRQGVAIAFFIKRGLQGTGIAQVHHAERWGGRACKYEWLQTHALTSTDWSPLTPRQRFFLLRPLDRDLQDTYNAFVSVTSIFGEDPASGPGIVTTHDQFAISWSQDEARRKVELLLHSSSEAEARMVFKLCSQAQWSYERAKRELADGQWRQQLAAILYRPFDVRWTVFNRNVAVHRRESVMRHMLQDNLALCVGRAGQVVGAGAWNLAFCACSVVDYNCFYRGGNVNLPLYVYPSADRGDLFAHLEPSEREANLHPKLVAALADAYGEEPTPEAIFGYVYALLYAATYRERYAESLGIDFPRVPFTADADLFAQMASLGGRLTALHLLRSPELDPPSARFEGTGDGLVAKGRKAGLRYDPAEQRVYINATQHFAPVPQAVWDYRVGGYQVCEKWLKDRRERRLGLEDIKTYCRIVTALGLTIEIQQALDALYPQIEETLLAIEL